MFSSCSDVTTISVLNLVSPLSASEFLVSVFSQFKPEFSSIQPAPILAPAVGLDRSVPLTD